MPMPHLPDLLTSGGADGGGARANGAGCVAHSKVSTNTIDHAHRFVQKGNPQAAAPRIYLPAPHLLRDGGGGVEWHRRGACGVKMNGVVDETGGRIMRAAGAAAAAAQGQEAEEEGRERVGRSRHEGNERPHAHARHNATTPSPAAAPRARRRVASRHRNAVRQADRLQRPSCRCSRRPPARSAPPSPPILPKDNLASCNEGDAARIRGLWKQPPFIIPARRLQASWLRLRQQASPAVPTTRRFILRSRTVEEEEKINQRCGECDAPLS